MAVAVPVAVLGRRPARSTVQARLPCPHIARYAQGTRDYHDVMRSKLEQLADSLHGFNPDAAPAESSTLPRCWSETTPGWRGSGGSARTHS